ncbi:hypothetical protein HUE46_03945 [Flavobacterium columnare]|uniref:hypothetical protein n=1 Tax=Flavobacterium columnare TaxID=996 RepID=UPI0007F9E20A|nr:hypothetical protein [Flavobacterium columnare]ANO47650.1 outer membrane protein precursor [Flavobacterium columnare]APT21728.1 hypothetical protein BU993_03195 [Flavobacterium columnare]QOG89230.1 hypothetical protein HUE41_03945 [Flavobacterium columnare]QOG91889.1 hypothetical protein HUE42_03940 [Flavobacterium columnare]QOG94553.1 hypothetical protein HUE43_03945 [Flavobacterium columnare]
MKQLILLILYFTLSQKNWGQYLVLKTEGNSIHESKIIDSLSSYKRHPNLTSLNKEISQIAKKLTEKGYIEQTTVINQKINDSTYYIRYKLGDCIQKIHIFLGTYKNLLENDQDTLKIDFKNINDQFLKFTITLEKKGYPLSQIRLSNINKRGKNLVSEIIITKDPERTINQININGYPNFPKNHLNIILKHHKKRIFNDNELKKINNDFKKLPFCKITKEAEILFTKDSTTIYTYLEKQKRNTFDGYIGFTSLKNNLKLNGYLDFKLLNTLNWGEKFNIYWKDNGEQQSVFNLNTEIPYLFKTPLIVKGELSIFKQDSIFQKTKSEIELGYLLNYNTRWYIGYQETESSDIQNSDLKTLTDYKNFFYTFSFHHLNYNSNEIPFFEKTNFILKIGTGRRNTSKSISQFFTLAELSHLFYLNDKNSLFVKSQNYYLKSSDYLTNELFQFGGINSIRGFNDNSLQTNLLTSILSEYRYKINNHFYLHSIIDYAYTENIISNTKSNLKSLGVGFYLVNKKSTIHLQYSNGTSNKKGFNSRNSIFHINLLFIL